MCVHRDGPDARESHVVTKKFEVKQLDSDVSSQNDDNVSFGQTISVGEVRCSY